MSKKSQILGGMAFGFLVSIGLGFVSVLAPGLGIPILLFVSTVILPFGAGLCFPTLAAVGFIVGHSFGEAFYLGAIMGDPRMTSGYLLILFVIALSLCFVAAAIKHFSGYHYRREGFMFSKRGYNLE